MTGSPCAVVYRWDDAPEELRALSNHGGDEDWVIVLDAEHNYCWQFDEADNGYIPGWGNVSRFEVDDAIVVILAHA